MKTRAFIWLALALALPSPSSALAKDTVRASRGQITLPTYPWAAVKHPYFRGTDGVNIYPYPMLDFLSRDKTNRTYQTVILENDYLRITFLPELGGKIHEVLDKTTGQPMFYVNHVVKPALIGQAGAWTSGGVEWNTGPQGHTVGCLQPVDVVVLPRAKDGSQSVAIGETERIYGTKWTVVVTLRPGRSFIEERIRIYNPTETVRPYYFWNCTAVPNTKGFRFIYPMTLGMDHSGEKFFEWPIDHGKDLTRGTNYQDASSIFAYHCDQDFFGSYNDDLDRGVVAYANHHQLPGKKAWTWGWGSYGTMHQMDLTDDDGPYNEVQTGPLLTQGEVGRLDPCEAVEWREWWYPIHGLGGFTYANKDVAVNVARDGGKLQLQMFGSGTWKNAVAKATKDGRELARARCSLTPQKPTELALDLGGEPAPVEIEIGTDKQNLARFRFPLDLPDRKPPGKKPSPQTASELAQAGWEDFLFARFREAEARFHKALESDSKCVEAHTGLAYLILDPDPTAAAESARAALAVAPENGRARFALAVAEYRLGKETAALDAAWQAALDPATAIAGRALAAKILIRRQDWTGAIHALEERGPWRADPLCRDRLAFACERAGRTAVTAQQARESLAGDPLDVFAMSLIERAGGQSDNSDADVSRLRPEARRELAVELTALAAGTNAPEVAAWPYRYEEVAPLRAWVAAHPADGQAALSLGHLLFQLGRYAEGRAMWKKAAALGTEPVIACRALGMAAKTLDGDLKSAREWLEKANQADPKDSIVARDLARVLFDLADKAGSDADKRALTIEARDRLQGAFEEGKGRSDFVALLARSHNRLGDFAGTARLLDSVRITIWEGAHEAHDLFAEAHLALGDAQMQGGHAAEALAEFNRALEYPKNLATGRLETTREAHIHYRRGNALAALGRKDEAADAWRQAADEPPSSDGRIESAREQAAAALQALSAKP